mmetsp:Transcript_16725/g.15084  ORF Transcript_16725/g.15084 Transcript_16725/m.15084 type:complete len:237 (+) Transcript_16725:20-730(+)
MGYGHIEPEIVYAFCELDDNNEIEIDDEFLRKYGIEKYAAYINKNQPVGPYRYGLPSRQYSDEYESTKQIVQIAYENAIKSGKFKYVEPHEELGLYGDLHECNTNSTYNPETDESEKVKEIEDLDDLFYLSNKLPWKITSDYSLYLPVIINFIKFKAIVANKVITTGKHLKSFHTGVVKSLTIDRDTTEARSAVTMNMNTLEFYNFSQDRFQLRYLKLPKQTLAIQAFRKLISVFK